MATKQNSKEKTFQEQHEKSQSNLPNRLYRTEKNKIIGGVAGGLGEYFGFDPTLVRVIFVFLAIFGGSGIILYIVLWTIMPSASQMNIPSGNAIKANVEEIKEKAKDTAQSLNASSENNNRSFFAILLVIVGILFLINNYGIFSIHIERLWPLLLILLGLLLLRRR